MITDILSALHAATDLPVVPLLTNKIRNQIVYNNYTSRDNGAKAIHRLELRLITLTYEEAESYRQKIIECLVPIGDSVKINGVTDCELNGGGSLYDDGTKTYHTLLYFDYITRSLINER